MRKIIYVVLIGALMVSCKVKNEVRSSNSEGWVTLFDGTNYDNWKGYLSDEMYEEWTIDDGAMLFTPSENKNRDIITKLEYSNFELSIEWKISEGGNSGIFWGVKEDPKLKIYQTGPEIQVLDNERHPDAKNNPKFHQAGALYDMMQPTQDVCNPAGEWNAVLLKVNHKTNKGSVTLNGTVIVEFPVHGPEWDALIENSKFSGWDGFGKYKTGNIGLQDHSDKVWYRNIKIKKLD